MKKFNLISLSILFLLLSSYQNIVLGNVTSTQESRIALLIGNQGYQTAPLDNPHNDVDDMETALKAVGFQVRKLKEQTLWEMEQAIIGFGKQLEQNQNSVGLFYFSGHGMQYRGKNFLFPIGSMASVSVPGHLRVKTLDVEYLLAAMAGAGNQLNLIFLDACRDNNFLTRGWFKGGRIAKGLAPMQAPSGSLIAYATRANHPASNRKGQRNSPYTRHLTQEISKPGLSIFEMLTNVRVAVKKETNGLQEPEYYSALDGKFCFKGPCGQISKQLDYYSLGKKSGTIIAQQIWDSLNHDCGNSDEFFKNVENAIDRTQILARKSSKQMKEYHVGYIEGNTNVLEVVLEKCRQECSEVGKASGEMSASVFCATSKALGHVATFRWMTDIPSISCREEYRMSCESAFYQKAKKECPFYAKGSAFDRYYRASLGGCCAYNPKETEWK